MKRVFNFRVIPLILLGIILGICAVTYLDGSLVIACVAGAAILLVCAICVKQMMRARGKLIAMLLAFCFAMGITSLSFDWAERNEIYINNALITARIDVLSKSSPDGEIEADGGQVEIYVEEIEIDGIKYQGKAVAVFNDGSEVAGFRIGDVIKFRGDVTPLIFDTEDSYSVADYTDGIYYHVYVQAFADEEDRPQVLYNDATLADKIKLRIKSALYSNTKESTAGFLYAMTFGDKSGLTSEIKDAFSYTGTAHVFAVSGLHVGIIAGAVIAVLKRLRIRNSIAGFCTVAVILMPFCALCEFSPSTVRATLMVLVALAAKIFMRRSDAMTNLAAAGCILLIVNPFYLFDLGFLMSFSAVFGLITLARPVQKGLMKIKIPSALAGALAASISANIALMPIMLVYFGGQSLIFIIANLLIIPLIGLLFPFYLAIVFIAAFASFSGVLLTLVGAPFTLMIYVIEKLSEVNFLMVNFNLNRAFIVLNFIFILALSKFIIIPDKAKKITAGITGAVFCTGLLFNLNIQFENQTTLHFFTDASGCQMMLLDDYSRGSYLIVNGEPDYTSGQKLRDVMREKHVNSIDGVFVVGSCDEDDISDLMFYSNCSRLYSFSDKDYLYSGYDVGTIVTGEDFMIGYYSYGLLDIIVDGTNIKVLADGYSLNKADDIYDIIVCYESVGVLDEGRYAVCEAGYVNSLKNYMPSAFTIVIKDDKINTNAFRG